MDVPKVAYMANNPKMPFLWLGSIFLHLSSSFIFLLLLHFSLVYYAFLHRKLADQDNVFFIRVVFEGEDPASQQTQSQNRLSNMQSM
jgi:hypothetical protein